jgi:hypothetical protein
MNRMTQSERARAWIVDYSAARAQAIRWLGERYLLAKPINARAAARRRASSLDSPPPSIAARTAPA